MYRMTWWQQLKLRLRELMTLPQRSRPQRARGLATGAVSFNLMIQQPQKPTKPLSRARIWLP